MKGGIGWNLRILGVFRDSWEFYMMFLSQEIDNKLFQICTKIYYIKFCIKIVVLNRSFVATIQAI